MSKIDKNNLDPGETFEMIAMIHRCILIGPILMIVFALYAYHAAIFDSIGIFAGALGILGFYHFSRTRDTCVDSLIALTNLRIIVIYKSAPPIACVIRFSDISSIVTIRNNWSYFFKEADVMITCVGSSTSYYLSHVKDAVVFRDMVLKYMRNPAAPSDLHSSSDSSLCSVDFSPADAVQRSLLPEERVASIYKLIKQGGLSAAGLALKLDFTEGDIVDECIRLYKGGLITKCECERVLMRKIEF